MGRDVLGGQAVLEGVLMFGKGKYAVAVRASEGVVVEKGPLPKLSSRLANIPFLRGLAILYLTFFVAVKAMHFSTNQALDDDEVGWGLIAAVVFVSLALMLFLLTVLPFFIANSFVPVENAVLFNLVEGFVRIALFIIYVLAISLMPDVRRMYRYHGAEHKVVNAFERTGKLSKTTAMKESILHPRCSTSFVVLVLGVAILIFALVPTTLHWSYALALRLLLLFPIVGAGFELVKLTGDHASSWWAAPLVWAGFVIQKLTTAEPDESMVEVALTAAQAVVRA